MVTQLKIKAQKSAAMAAVASKGASRSVDAQGSSQQGVDPVGTENFEFQSVEYKKKHAEAMRTFAAEESYKRKHDDRLQRMNYPARCLANTIDVVNSMPAQTILYMIFVVLFQNLASCMRLREEFLVDKHVMDRIVENHFDSSHNTFESIRRTADIYEWGNNVLWPGLFGDMGPCNSDVGLPDTLQNKGCVDEAWPDGEGSFQGSGATPFGIDDLVERMDQFDWTEGIMIRQARVGAADCSNRADGGRIRTLGPCYPMLGPAGGRHFGGSTDAFGYNWTHPGGAAPDEPWRHYTAEELGANPMGVTSAAVPSQATYEASGFVAVVIPFFSDVFLPEERGLPADVTDFRRSYVNVSNGRTARHYCVRLSLTGSHVRQLCDPGTSGNGTGTYTGAVRAAVEEMWNDLKRGHYIDARTRVLTVTLQLKSNPLGVRYRMTLMLEQAAAGTWFTSYDTETRILDESLVEGMGMYANIALALIVVFCLVEGIELSNGVVKYFSDMWNVMDWTNFIIFFIAYGQIQEVFAAIDETPENTACTSYICGEVGYFDDWKVMSAFRDAKTTVSLCVCIVMFKILKFAGVLVPKMGLATAVLKKAAIDIAFFGIVFIIAMLAFSMMLHIQLGPVMMEYAAQLPAFLALLRALFGDFDIDDILDNSSGYLNAILFLAYLFVAIFIMTNMFIAILAEAQVMVRDDEKAWKNANTEAGRADDEYGIVSATGRLVSHYVTDPAVTKAKSLWAKYGGGDEGGGNEGAQVFGGDGDGAAGAGVVVNGMQVAGGSAAGQQSADTTDDTFRAMPIARDLPAPSYAPAPAPPMALNLGYVNAAVAHAPVATRPLPPPQTPQADMTDTAREQLNRMMLVAGRSTQYGTPGTGGSAASKLSEGEGLLEDDPELRQKMVFDDIAELRERFEEIGSMRKDALLWQALAMEQNERILSSHESINKFVGSMAERLSTIENLLFVTAKTAMDGGDPLMSGGLGAISEEADGAEAGADGAEAAPPDPVSRIMAALSSVRSHMTPPARDIGRADNGLSSAPARAEARAERPGYSGRLFSASGRSKSRTPSPAPALEA